MDIIVAYASNNLCYKSAQPMKPVGLLLHSTGCNNPNLKRYVNCPTECGVNANKNYWDVPQPDGQKKCVHGFIGYDKNKKVRAAQILPHDISSWGCGKGSKGSFNYNPTGFIQYELCEDSTTDATYFKQAWDCAVELFAGLCVQYNLNPLGKNVIVSHKEAATLGYASNHGDPEHWFAKHGKTMDDFRKAVKAKMGNATTTAPSKAKYTVQVGAFASKQNAENYAAKIRKLTIDGQTVNAFVKEIKD